MQPPSLSEWQLDDLLKQVATQPSSALESETLEFKAFASVQSLHNSKELAEELSALANHKGGIIIVGVRAENAVASAKYESQIVGMPDGDPIEVMERLRGKLRPTVDLRVDRISSGGKLFLVIAIGHPRNTLVSTSSGKFYIREGRSSRPMTPDEIQAAVKSLTNYDWSADVIDGHWAALLDLVALEQAHADFCARRKLESPPDIAGYLEAIGATSNGHLVRGGLMFLGTTEGIRSLLGDHEYRFAWKTKSGELKINDVWSGCIWSAVQRAKKHFGSCNSSARYSYKDSEFEAPLLDDTAFHEAYLNALVHRDYSSDGMISVSLMGDQMTIVSPGGFYGGVTAENIALHEPRHRNKLLARILMSHHLVDRAGMGVLRMGLGSLRYGRSFPRFAESFGNIEVSIEAKYLKPPVAALSLNNPDSYGIAELLVLNSVVEVGAIGIADLIKRLARLVDDPWHSIQDSIVTLGGVVELCGTQSGIFVRVAPRWRSYMEVSKEFVPSKNSEKHVALYKYLRQHGEASNSNLRRILGHAHSSQTSGFLRHAKYVERTGSGPSARWSLVYAK